MKIELDLKTIFGILAIVGMIVGATVTIYTTFETKANHQKLEEEFDTHIYYHMSLSRGSEPVFAGPIATEDILDPP